MDRKEEQERLTDETKEMEDKILAVLMTIEVKDPVVFYMALLNILMIVGETVKMPEVVQKRIFNTYFDVKKETEAKKGDSEIRNPL